MHASVLAGLVHAHLAPAGVPIAPALDRRVVRSIAATVGEGARTLEGERHLAVHADAGPEGRFSGFAITSARLVAAGRSVPLGAVRGARPRGGGGAEIATWAGPLVVGSAAAPALGAFCAALGQVPDAQRLEPPRPLVRVTEADPLGVLPELHGAAAGVDRVALEIASLLMGAVSRPNEVPLPAAQDLAARAVLLHRARNEGRGMTPEGTWTSPLAAPDLSAALAQALGPPDATEQKDEILTLRFGAASVRVAPWGTMSSLRIEPLGGEEGIAARARVFEPLLAAEGRLLVLRVLFGWLPPAESLAATSIDEILRRSHELQPGVDLSALVPGMKAPSDDAPVSKPPETLRKEALSRLESAKADVDPDAVIQAALELMNLARGYDDAAKAFADLAKTYPDRRADATYFQGNAVLASVVRDRDELRPDDVPRLERAIALFEEAMRQGKPSIQVDESFWQAATAIARVHPSKLRRRGVLEVYEKTFPRGGHVAEAREKIRGI